MTRYIFEVVEYGERYRRKVDIEAPNEVQAYLLVAQEHPAALHIERISTIKTKEEK